MTAGVDSDQPLFGRAAIEAVFRSLGERLARRGVIGDICVVGGAAMAMAYDSRRSTRDIGAVFVPRGVVLEEARAVAAEFSLPPWWLSEQASVYVAPGGDKAGPRVFEHPGLRVTAASAEHLLAMKVLAACRGDEEDISVLVTRLGFSSAAEVFALCEEVFPVEPVPDRARLMVEDIVTSL